MKRANLNLVVDILGFAGFVFLTATGVLVRYVLPPGSGHHTRLWGLDRHEWGGIHFWIAVGFLLVLALHVVLHWRWIASVLGGRPREGSGVRLALGVVGVLAILAVAVAPFAGSAEKTTNASSRGGEPSISGSDSELVRGRMSLSEIEQRTGVPVAYIIEHLGVPSDVPLNVGVGKLGKQFGFDIGDVRRAIQEYRAVK